MADNTQVHSNTSGGKTGKEGKVTVHNAQFGMSGKASDLSIALSSGDAARRAREENKRKKEKNKK